MKNNLRGFSLVQILVTILIIVVLLGFSIVAFQQAAKRARRAKCSSNLKQIYQYLMMYLEDNNDVIPAAKGIDEVGYKGDLLKDILIKYTEEEEIFYCPSDPRDRSEIEKTGSYDWRRSLKGITFSSINDKGKRIIIGDFRAGWHDHGAKEKRINVLFADGHVEWITEDRWQEEIRKGLL